MSAGELQLESHPRGVILPVRAHAGARKTGIVGMHNGMLRVAVTAAPEKGKANKVIVAVLAKALGVPKSAIDIVSGETSPQKRFLLVSCDAERVRAAVTPSA
jgi:uncharacterized protein (TIGR00251 family)